MRLALCAVAAATICGIALPAGAARAAEGVTPIGRLTSEYRGRLADVQGTVASARRFAAGMRYVLADGTGKITLVVFDDVLKGIARPEALGPGAELRVGGKVDVYRDQIQLVPRRAADISVIVAAPAEDAPLARLGALGAADKGKTVVVEGVVVGAASFSAGFKFALNDGSGQISLVLYEREYDGVRNRDALNVGARVRAKGALDAYFSELQIAPKAGDVSVTAGMPPKVRNYALGAITGNDHNALVQVQGEVARVDPFDSGAYVLLKDATGAQRIVLYENVLKRISKGVKLTPGSQLSVIGRVKAARSTGIRIEPALAADVSGVQ